MTVRGRVWRNSRSLHRQRQLVRLKVAEGDGRVKDWREVGGCSVLFPSAPPTAILHFAGGVFACATPLLFYREFLENLCEATSAVVVVTPYKTSFDHDAAAQDVLRLFDAAWAELVGEGKRGTVSLDTLPVFGIGHSLGARVMLIAATKQCRAGSVLMSFNQRPVSEAIPVALPAPPSGSATVVNLIRSGLEEMLDEQRISDGLRRAGDFAGTAAQLAGNALLRSGAPASSAAEVSSAAARAEEVAPLISQLGPVLGDITAGTRAWNPSPEDLGRIAAESDSLIGSRILLVEFANDAIDETPWAFATLQARADPSSSNYGQIELERLRVPGGHTEPLDLPRSGANERLSQLATSIGSFLRRDVNPSSDPSLDTNDLRLTELKAQLLRLTAGTNRGFESTSRARRADILACVEEMEALSPESEAWYRRKDGSAIPTALFGNWRLIWSTAPDVLLLAALPLVDCGEVRQDIPFQEVVQGQPLEVENSVELSPAGAGLLSLLPPAVAGAAGVKVAVRAEAESRGPGRLSIRFTGGTIQSMIPGLPALPLPTLPSFQLSAGGLNLLTTFLDQEIRVARSPLSDVFVLLRVD